MKVVHDEDLSLLHSYTQPIAKKIAKDFSKKIIDEMTQYLAHDDKFGDLTYTGAMTFINTVGTNVFLRIFDFSCHIGKQFPDVGHCSREIFEELIAGLRIMANYPEESKTEYAGGIKKISIKED